MVACTVTCLSQNVTYTSRTAFNAAVAGIAGTRLDLGFEPPLPPGGTSVGGGAFRYWAPWAVGGLTFGGEVLLIRPERFPLASSTNNVLNNYDSFTPLTVGLNGLSRAFGAEFGSLLSPTYSSFTATVSLDNGEVFTFTAPANPNRAFFGFVTTQSFSKLTFSDGALVGVPVPLHEEILDNITAIVVVPEPSVTVLCLLAGGLICLCRVLRRRRTSEIRQV